MPRQPSLCLLGGASLPALAAVFWLAASWTPFSAGRQRASLAHCAFRPRVELHGRGARAGVRGLCKACVWSELGPHLCAVMLRAPKASAGHGQLHPKHAEEQQAADGPRQGHGLHQRGQAEGPEERDSGSLQFPLRGCKPAWAEAGRGTGPGFSGQEARLSWGSAVVDAGVSAPTHLPGLGEPVLKCSRGTMEPNRRGPQGIRGLGQPAWPGPSCLDVPAEAQRKARVASTPTSAVDTYTSRRSRALHLPGLCTAGARGQFGPYIGSLLFAFIQRAHLRGGQAALG